MRPIFPALLLLLALSACAGTSAPTGGRAPTRAAASDGLPAPMQCVPFVREITGIELYGNANTWWPTAAGKGYQRGTRPMVGAVLVLKESDRLRDGHVAAVRQIVSPREIRVTHANWGQDAATRRMVHDAMPVIDASPANDWSQPRFWNERSQSYGAVYPAFGFIYPSSNKERRNVPVPTS
jgi:hypothetical protein